MVEEVLLDVKGLSTVFVTPFGRVPVLNGISFRIYAGETLGIVGESGSGKTVTAMSILRLLRSPQAKIEANRIDFLGQDLLSMREREMRRIRGNQISMIFQEPMTSLNPVFTIGDQIEEVLRVHRGLNARESRRETVNLLKLVEIPMADKRVLDYPHRLSGGMRQRVMIAMALACHPKLLIADEPTTALDVTIQAQILELITRLKKELDMSVMLITHDLGIVAEVTKRMITMYAGTIVEEATTRDIFENPLHPYTSALLNSIPEGSRATRGRLQAIPGSVPTPQQYPSGCRFHTRCPSAMAICAEKSPIFSKFSQAHSASCWRLTGADGNAQVKPA